MGNREMDALDTFESLLRGMAADLEIQVDLSKHEFAKMLRQTADRIEGNSESGGP